MRKRLAQSCAAILWVQGIACEVDRDDGAQEEGVRIVIDGGGEVDLAAFTAVAPESVPLSGLAPEERDMVDGREPLAAPDCEVLEGPTPLNRVPENPTHRQVGYQAIGRGRGCADACVAWGDSLYPEVTDARSSYRSDGSLRCDVYRRLPLTNRGHCEVDRGPTAWASATPIDFSRGPLLSATGMDGLWATGNGDAEACGYACFHWRERLKVQYGVPDHSAAIAFQSDAWERGWGADYVCLVARYNGVVLRPAP